MLKRPPRNSLIRQCFLPSWCIYPFERTGDQAVRKRLWKRNLKRIKKEKVRVCVSRRGRAVLWITIELCLRRCPWYFECVVMYAWYERRRLVRTGTEAEFLVQLLANWTVLLWSSPDSFDSVRELGRRIKVPLEKAALYFCC